VKVTRTRRPFELVLRTTTLLDSRPVAQRFNTDRNDPAHRRVRRAVGLLILGVAFNVKMARASWPSVVGRIPISSKMRAIMKRGRPMTIGRLA
jgi:hypothetical protein